ncbi:ferrous iron transport protein A [Fortiea sp. LEGE XX443]|uniref:FeoA family protein n=1 Tax=Fortiea sp. LEGE XX443 TaxID=1828611 RepID=UPI0018815279|nr:FeoA family protein [Fortiea sp. LEGE XX443]MBE9005088.1 ferrous iron transport protein A [Fortiea sp. LEGE XX443]
MFTPFTVSGCSLELLKIGEQGIVTFYRTQDEEILKELISQGIIIGTKLTVENDFTDFLIQIDNKYVLINREVACIIYVRLLKN